jgi:integrase
MPQAAIEDADEAVGEGTKRLLIAYSGESGRPFRVDLITVAELLGHARLDTTRIYALPTAADRAAALEALVTDR